jgi:hypothetical protein
MEFHTLYKQLGAAVGQGNHAEVRRLLTQNPGVLEGYERGGDFLGPAAIHNDVEMLSLLVEFGADVNAPANVYGGPEGVIDDAAGFGAIDAVRWLLDHGAKINHVVEGELRCFALTGAVNEGRLDIVKLLLERGAEINASWRGLTALGSAVMFGKGEIAAFLRSKRAIETLPLTTPQPPDEEDAILHHIEEHFGKPNPLSLHEIVPADPPITIRVARCSAQVTLVTLGMSARPMNVPEGGEPYRFAELLIELPPDWPLSSDALGDPNYSWPITWLRRIARYPHQNQTWLGGAVTIIANGEPPQPLAPNTAMTCLLVMAEPRDLGGQLSLADGKEVVFYNVFPLYTEERDLEKAEGIEHLVRLFRKFEISTIVNVARRNVAGGSR